MYRHLSRAPSRTLSGHVCLSCRRSFHLTPAQRHDGPADDWLSNFNDLSVSSETKSRRPKREGRENDDGTSALQDEEGGKAAAGHLSFTSNDRSRDGTSRESEGNTLDDTSSSALEGIPQETKTLGQASQDVRQTYESVIESLIAESLHNPEEAKVKMLEDLLLNPENNSQAAKAKSLDDLVRDTEQDPEVASREDTADGRPLIRRLNSAQDSEAASREDTAEGRPLIRMLNSGRHESDEPFRFIKARQSPVDDVNVAGGTVSAAARTSRDTPDDLTGQPMSIVARARAFRDRPKWGDMTKGPDNTGQTTASFDSFRRADKVSAPPERPSTATPEQPWGFKAHDAPPGFAISPGELAVSQEASHSLQNNQADVPPPGSFRGLQGFKRLKNIFFGDEDGGKKPNSMAESSVEKQTHQSSSQNKEPRNVAETPDDANVDVRGKDTQNDLPGSRPAESSEQDDHDNFVSVPPNDETSPSLDAPAKRNITLRRQRARQRRKERKEAMKAAREPKSDRPSDVEKADLPEFRRPATTAQAPDSSGQSLADAMVGRQLSDAMGSAEGAATEEHVDESDSGLPVVKAKDLEIKALNIEQPPVPGLSYGLDRVLFTSGVTSLQDQHSRVYNFDPYLQHIMPVEEFDFNSLQEYKTSSQDRMLSEIAKTHSKKYVGSTSSMTSTLSHFHYLLSEWRDLNHGMLSRQFPEQPPTFTAINRAPTAIFLRWKNGTYAIDADKENDSGNILMMLGKSMEKLLTLNKSDYERYRKSDPRVISQEERNLPEAYEYTTMGDFLMRSQLDAYDPRLPGTGMFDIKTRAIASIRMSTNDYKPMLGYEILTQQGAWQSYEREYSDMTRSTMLKYMLQARMGRMDGIFLAYHNVQRMFGFQYMPISEMDRVLHGQINRCLGDQEFKLSLDLLNKVLEQATAKFPNKSLRLHFETRASPVTAMYIFAEPMEENQIDEIQSKSKAKIAEFERKMMGIEARDQKETPSSMETENNATVEDAPPASTINETHSPLYAATILIGSRVNGHRVERPERLRPSDTWSVEYLLKEMEDPAAAWATYAQTKERRRKAFSRAVVTDDEGEAEATDEDLEEPNREIHEKDGSVRKFESDYFLEHLRRMAESGREMRAKIDEAERDQEKVVFGLDSSSSSALGNSDVKKEQDSVEAGINGVEDYMAWMYKDQNKQ